MTTVSNYPNRKIAKVCENGCDAYIGEMSIETIKRAEEFLEKYRMTNFDAFILLQEVFFELFDCDMFDYNEQSLIIDPDEKK